MCFNYSKRLLFVGTASSFSAQLTGNFNTLVPAVYALECSGYELTCVDKIEVPEAAASLGIFTIHCHPTENIVFCTFTTKVLVSYFHERSFKKFRVINSFSSSNVYQSSLNGSVFCGYCAKEESISILSFPEKAQYKDSNYNLRSAIQSQDWPIKQNNLVQDKQRPLMTKYSFIIPEFKEQIKFTLVDWNMSLMFVAVPLAIFRCVITRKSLVMDDKSVSIGTIV